MASPNAEQLKAIEHEGGVLLKAGAGSGKTFVLREHILYLVRLWIKNYGDSSSDTFDSYIKRKFSEVVLMTFTKKAAGELKDRVDKALKDLADCEKGLFKKAYDQLEYLTISTIDGFCHKLIKMGFLGDFNLDQPLLNSNEVEDFVQHKFTEWIEGQPESTLKQLVVSQKSSVVPAFAKVLQSPELKNEWESNINSTLQDSVALDGLCQVLDLRLLELIPLGAVGDDRKKKYVDFFHLLARSLQEIDWNCSDKELFIRLYKLLSSMNFSICRKPSGKNIDPEITLYHQRLKKINDFFKKHSLSFDSYFESDDIDTWFEAYSKFFSYLSQEYYYLSGMTFADIELEVYKGLQKPEVQKGVQDQFKYLIVDEFQDTSYLQFNILRKVINDDFSKLFCVGDMKQAIYGFRGGELGVFTDCEKMIPRVLELSNNYRSEKEVISFNNEVFDFVLQRGKNFEDIDPNAIEVKKQTIPDGRSYIGGRVNQYVVDPQNYGLEKLSSFDINKIEALGIFNVIQKNLTNKEQTAVLYKTLKPSSHLISLLIDNNIGFTAQAKISYLEDPVISLFNLLIETKLDHAPHSLLVANFKYSAFMNLILGDGEYDFTSIYNDFLSDSKIFGVYQAFVKFIYKIGISNSNYLNNLDFIKKTLSVTKGDFSLVASTLQRLSSKKYSLNYQYGANADSVILMTAHSSKGLEFEHVILGGIYTNGTRILDHSSLGGLPESFSYKNSKDLKQKLKTPMFLLEGILNEYKEMAESKRLFYVANTRAEKVFSWIQIDFGDIKTRISGESWIKGLNNYLATNSIRSINTEKLDLKFVENDSKVEVEKPLIQIDDIGVTPNKKQTVFIMPELSVTRFSSIINCPKKFYLQNICKLSGDNVVFEKEDRALNEEFSSAQRGTDLHYEIEQYIKTHKQTEKPELKWITQLIDTEVSLQKSLVSEKLMKFQINGYMITGIPDAILYDKNGIPIEVWDFKTGQKKTDNENYLFQLKCYAQALIDKFKISTMKVSLLWIDENSRDDFVVEKTDLSKYFSNVWSKVDDLTQENHNHCSKCCFGNICTISC